ncbi:MAG: PRC-barrel domain-containing protein [Alphaproteobacteria bacterium]
MKRIIPAVMAIALAVPMAAQAADNKTPYLSTQAATEWRMANYLGQPVVNSEGEKIGKIYDVLFSKEGHVKTVVIGVGGFLGMGSKLVAVPFEVVTYGEKDGNRVITAAITKESLKTAPVFTLTEKTTMDKVRDKAGAMAEKAGKKASELKEQAVKKIDEYSKKPEKQED